MAPTIDQLRPMSAAQQQLILEQKRAFLAKHPASRRFLFEPSRLWSLIVAHRYIPPSIAEDSSEANEYDDLRLSFTNFKKIAYIILFGEGAADDEDAMAVAPPVVSNADRLSDEEKELIFFTHPFLSPKTFLMFERSVDNYQSARSLYAQNSSDHTNNINNSDTNNISTTMVLNSSHPVKSKKESPPVPETVSSVPLYTYIAKKMLLYRMRIMLELVASVPPPTLRVIGGDASTGSGGSGDRRGGGLGIYGGGVSPHIQRHCAPSPSSPLSNGLTQDDVEGFIKQLVPQMRLVRDMPPWLLPYYLCHASRKIMFMLDPRGLGVISIESFMVSDVFSELIRMYESEMRDAVVAFPVGCALEILPATAIEGAKRHHGNSVMVKANGGKFDINETMPEWLKRVAAAVDEDYFLKCSVEDFESEGNDPTDNYTVNVICPKEYRDPETGIIEVFTVIVPRDGLVWCPSTTAYIPPELSAVTNWFSLPLMYRIYDHFTLLDADSDGVLTVEEFSKYSGGSYTELAAKRVFDVHVRDSGGRHVMDYKSYLTFVVATEHVGTSQGKKYLWDVLDIEHTRDRISVNALRLFCKEISEKLAENNLMKITADSILSEIIDMINPQWHEWVTREDISRSRQHHTVLPILLSHRNFYAYDCREQSAAQTTNEYV